MKRIVPIVLTLALAMFSQAQAASTICYTVAACVLGANLGPGPGGAGLEGQAQNAYGVLGFSTYNVGVYGYSGSNFGVVGVTTYSLGNTGNTLAGVYGVDQGSNATNAGVLANSSHGKALAAITSDGYGVYANAVGGGTAIYAESTGGTVLSLAIPNLTQPYLLLGTGQRCPLTCVTIDAEGNETLAGTLTTVQDAQVRTHSASGDVTTYGARSAEPTLEDTGTAKLTYGAAFVALDKTFASTIAPGYMVFVTPHGDSNSLYTVPSTAGFTVRESKGGRSTLSFDYRIVARPADAKGARLAALAPPKRTTFVKPVMPKLQAPKLPHAK